jgi:hypothetical protein
MSRAIIIGQFFPVYRLPVKIYSGITIGRGFIIKTPLLGVL